MRKTSEEFNCSAAIENVGIVCGKEDLEELPHWSTINNFLERLSSEELEKVISELVKRLIRMRSFENSRIRSKYWQIIIDGTQLYSGTNQENMDKRCLTRKHRNPDGGIRYASPPTVYTLENPSLRNAEIWDGNISYGLKKRKSHT